MKKLFITLLLILCICGSAAAAHIPLSIQRTETDSRRVITKTFEVPPDTDPDTLQEPSFDEDGYSYAFFEVTQQRNAVSDSKLASQPVSMEVTGSDLSEALKQLAPQLEYQEDGYIGTLTLDPSSVSVTASGYASKTSTLTDTQTFGGLDRNDPAYIPQSTVKNGVTLTLHDISWAVQETALSGSDLVPSKYIATATYRGSYSKQVATGYTATARYSGMVIKSGLESITYTLIYVGEAIAVPEPEVAEVAGPNYTPAVAITAAILLALVVLICLIRRRNVSIFIESGDEYSLTGKLRITVKNPIINLERAGINAGTLAEGESVAVLIKKRIAAKLQGRTIVTACGDFRARNIIDKQGCDFWYVVNPAQNNESEKE